MKDTDKSKAESVAAFKHSFAPKEMTKPTLERIYNAEQIGQGRCDNVQNYCREIESIIGVLATHLERVKKWQCGDADAREQFNSEFVLLMRELEMQEP